MTTDDLLQRAPFETPPGKGGCSGRAVLLLNSKARWCATNTTNELIPGSVFETLRPEPMPKDRKPPAAQYLEQFDVSYEYFPNMCERRSYATCIFCRDSRIREFCPPFSGAAWQGKLCPVAAYVCRYHYPCNPDGCPVREEEADLTKSLVHGQEVSSKARGDLSREGMFQRAVARGSRRSRR